MQTSGVDVNPGQQVLGTNYSVLEGQSGVNASPAPHLRLHPIGADHDPSLDLEFLSLVLDEAP